MKCNKCKTTIVVSWELSIGKQSLEDASQGAAYKLSGVNPIMRISCGCDKSPSISYADYLTIKDNGHYKDIAGRIIITPMYAAYSVRNHTKYMMIHNVPTSEDLSIVAKSMAESIYNNYKDDVDYYGISGQLYRREDIAKIHKGTDMSVIDSCMLAAITPVLDVRDPKEVYTFDSVFKYYVRDMKGVNE